MWSPDQHPQASAHGRGGRRENQKPGMHFVRIVAVRDIEKTGEKRRKGDTGLVPVPAIT
jgi:hypothetical protein